MGKNSYAIFGLGSFGSKLAVELSKTGNNVLVCDINPTRVDEYCDKVSEAVVLDASSADAIRELDVSKFDAVILGMSSHFEKQVLALTLLKQEGAKRILVKANTDIQERILYRLGADEVIQPEQDVAERLSRRLSLVSISDLFEFKGFAIAEVVVPGSLSGSTLRELDLSKRYHITVLLLRKAGSAEETAPGPDVILDKGDQMTVFGTQSAIIELFRKE